MTRDNDAPPQIPNPHQGLDPLFQWVWRALRHGARDARHDYHLPVLATRTPDGCPDQRTVVLRDVDLAARALVCHTDARSPKLRDIEAEPRVSWLFYDRTAKVQIRIRAVATVHLDNELADARWIDTPPRSRRCYLAPLPPGARTGSPVGNLPPDLTHDQPSTARSEAGRPHFAVIHAAVAEVDVLNLAHHGHSRALMRRQPDDTWTMTWTAP